MMRRPLALLALVGTILLLTSPAGAQTPDEVAARVADYGYWIDSGLPADPTRISAAISRAGNAGHRLFVVLLEDDPSGGPSTFADALLDRLGEGTVLVISATGTGMASWGDFDQTQIEAALDAGYATGGGDAEFVDAVVASLTGTSPDGGDGSAGGGGSKTGLIVILVLVGGLVLLVVWALRRQSKSAAQSKARAIEEARKEIKAQLDAMANTILEISDEVSASASREDNQYLEQASRAFTEASDGYEAAADLARLEEISDRLDEARWQLDAAAALAQGKPVPPRPPQEERHACFFDPTHRGPFEEAEVRTPAGSKTVRVCALDAEKLRRGEQPSPRMIEVNGRQVPAPSAPRSYGGGGFSWLDVFAVIVGGMGSARSYDWGTRPTSGGWGSRWGSGSGSSRPSGSGSSTPRLRVRARAGRTQVRRRR
jgi:cbb3-type cytochrome oxidase subunit 3